MNMIRQSFVSFAVLLVFVSLGSIDCSRSKSKSATADESDPGTHQEVVPGFKVEELKEGTGETAVPGRIIAVHYTGWLSNGAKFDSSLERQPLEFELGKKQALQGWDMGIPGMKVGGKRKITVPPALGYGDKGSLGGAIPPKATMVFDVELVAVK